MLSSPGYTIGEEVIGMVSAAGGRKGYVSPNRQRVYKALRRKGHTKKSAARIANAGISHAQRSRMSRKAARTRRAKGRK